MTDSLFNSAHDALVFAYNFSSQQYDRPLMNRLAAHAERSGRGLIGLDGAAQSGMIRAEVAALGRIPEAVIIARYAPPSVACACRASCCNGHKPNPEWRNAVATLADHMRTTALAGCTTNALLRRDLVIRYFAGHASIDALASRHGPDRHTVSALATKVARVLSTKKGGGLENAAFTEIDARLKACGIVE